MFFFFKIHGWLDFIIIIIIIIIIYFFLSLSIHSGGAKNFSFFLTSQKVTLSILPYHFTIHLISNVLFFLSLYLK